MTAGQHSDTLLTDPPSLLAIIRAARMIGDRELERSARHLLSDHHGIEVRFRGRRPLIAAEAVRCE